MYNREESATVASSPKVDLGAMRVGGGRAPSNSQHETEKTDIGRDPHKRGREAATLLAGGQERGCRVREGGGWPADLPPMTVGIRRGQGRDGQMAQGAGEGKRPVQETRGEPSQGRKRGKDTALAAELRAHPRAGYV